ncbi:DUF397 domain-containing protein [Streptosporangium sp. NPDC004379]|uniref:DUF397 domain-containing protein n=1 Tax=Streptosporangium sp. NPDC004379 TaxID=3366189 RepID=UPI003675C15A
MSIVDQALPGLAWRKSSQSAQQDNCVEVARLPGGGHAVRDSKDPDGPVLRFGGDGWRAFLEGVRAGAFDRPGH